MKTKSQISHRSISGERPMHGSKGQLYRALTETPSPEDKMVIPFENLDLMWYQGQINHARELYQAGADIVEITEVLGRKGTNGQYETVILLLYLLYKGKIKERPCGFLGEFQRIGGDQL